MALPVIIPEASRNFGGGDRGQGCGRGTEGGAEDPLTCYTAQGLSRLAFPQLGEHREGLVTCLNQEFGPTSALRE